MKFHNYRLLRSTAGRKMPANDFYQHVRLTSGSVEAVTQALVEQAWEEARRPYYQVWPVVLKMLLKLPLDLSSRHLRLPLPVLELRLPEGNPLAFEHQGERFEAWSVLVTDLTRIPTREFAFTNAAYQVYIDYGESVEMPGVVLPLMSIQTFHPDERPLAEVLADLQGSVKDSARVGVPVPSLFVQQVLQLVCCVGLLGEGSDLLEPDVLAADRPKYAATGDPKYVDRAHRKGKIGWNLGREIEKAPHYRRPHPALVWTGPGRQVPRIVLRRGSVVHRDVLKRLPHGFEDNPAQ